MDWERIYKMVAIGLVTTGGCTAADLYGVLTAEQLAALVAAALDLLAV